MNATSTMTRRPVSGWTMPERAYEREENRDMTSQDVMAHFVCDSSVAAKVVSLIENRLDPMTLPGVADWVRRCYSEPPRVEKILEALNELLEGYGTEVIRGRYVDSFWRESQLAYVNMGETYAPTIGYDTEEDEYVLTSWGDWYEANEDERELA